MAYQLIVQPQAEADIIEAFHFLSARSPEAAGRWYREVRAAMHSLAEMPARCPLAPEAAMLGLENLGLELRQLLYGKRPGIYRIVFRIVEDAGEVHILTVRDGARKPLTDEDIQPFLEL